MAAAAIASLASIGGEELTIMPAQEFISRLPARVINGGHVVAVRDDLAAMLMGAGGLGLPPGGVRSSGGDVGPSTGSGGGGSIVVADTAWAHGVAGGGGGEGSDVIATVQVKSGDGLQTLVVRLPATSTIKDLRAVVDAHRAHATRYELRTAYPRKALEDESISLADAKLAPTAVVHMRMLPPDAGGV